MAFLTTNALGVQSRIPFCPTGTLRSDERTLRCNRFPRNQRRSFRNGSSGRRCSAKRGRVFPSRLLPGPRSHYPPSGLPFFEVRLSHPGSAGFTLLEIVIALALLAMVVISLYASYGGTLESAELVEKGKDIELVGRMVLMQMADDLKSLYCKPSDGDAETSPYRFMGGMENDEGVKSVVEFASTSHLGYELIFPSLQINRVSYLLEEQAGKESCHRLVRRERPFADLTVESRETVVEMADCVKELTLEYFNSEGQRFSQWDSSSAEPSGSLPRLVRIRLQMATGNPDQPRLFMMTVSLPAWEETSEHSA